MLDELLDESLTPALIGAVGDDVAREVRKKWLTMSRICGQSNVVLMALRQRFKPVALDVLTVAIPREGSENHEMLDMGNGYASRPDSGTLGARLVSRDDLLAIAHRSYADETSTSIFRAHVQLVICIPKSDRGAIITMVSTEAGAENILECGAEEIASSMRLITDWSDAGESAGPA
jgi:hypothetical protein